MLAATAGALVLFVRRRAGHACATGEKKDFGGSAARPVLQRRAGNIQGHPAGHIGRTVHLPDSPRRRFVELKPAHRRRQGERCGAVTSPAMPALSARSFNRRKGHQAVTPPGRPSREVGRFVATGDHCFRQRRQSGVSCHPSPDETAVSSRWLVNQARPGAAFSSGDRPAADAGNGRAKQGLVRLLLRGPALERAKVKVTVLGRAPAPHGDGPGPGAGAAWPLAAAVLACAGAFQWIRRALPPPLRHRRDWPAEARTTGSWPAACW